MLKLRYLLLIGVTFCFQFVSAQCFEVKDGNGVDSKTPYFIACTPGNFTVFIQPNQAIGSYTINWGDGSPNSTGTSLVPAAPEQHTYLSTTDTFNVTITDHSTSCVVNAVVVMERNPLASIQLPSGDDNFGCTPVQFRFINSSTQISQTTTFTWDFGDGSPIEIYDHTNLGDTILHTYMPGIGVLSCDLEVTLTAANYCGSSTASFFPLKVWDVDEAVITPSDELLCYPDTVVQYVNNTIRNCYPEGNQSQRYEKWNFGDYWGLGRDSIINWRPWNPPIINPPPMGYPGIGVYSVTLIDSSFCGLDTTSISIEITSPPTAILTSNKDTICAGESVRFFNNTVGGANVFSWNYGQGGGWQNSSGSNKNRTFNTPGDFTIQLAVGISGARGCADTAAVEIHVMPAPIADFSFDQNNGCDSMLVNFTDQTTGSTSSWEWKFGNGNTYTGQSPPTQNYTSIGRHTVTLVTKNSQGCVDSIKKDIFVRETPDAGFTVSSVCLNTPASFIDQSSSPTDPITSYKWYFGDGDSSSAQDPSHLYTAFGSYNVIQIVDNGYCTDTDTIEVIVEAPPTAAFTADTLEGCSRLNINFINQSSANAVKFRWDFGDGSAIDTNKSPTHEFSNTTDFDTVYIVTLISQTMFGCSDTITDSVRVYPVPQPSFTSDAIAQCGPVEVNFTNTTLGNNLNFYWDFDDGSPISTIKNPSHTFENKTLFITNYNVSLIVESANGCKDTTKRIVAVYPEPNFSFTTTPDSACSPLTVRFPSVVGAVSYQWDFGDSTTASGPTPTHTFINNTTNNKTFRVRLVAQNSFGCEDTTYHNILVYPNPTSNFALDTNKGCQPLSVNITNSSIGASKYYWTFGDSTSSDTTDASFIKTYFNTTQLRKINQIKLITETTEGCKDTTSRNVEVHPFIEASFLSDSIGCSPLKIDFNNQSIGASAFIWQYGDGSNSSGSSPSHIFRNDSSRNLDFFVEMVAISPEGCRDTANKKITTFPKPESKYSISDSIGCHPLSVNFTNQSTLADSCFWTYGDGSGLTSCAPGNIHQYTNTNSYLPVDYHSQLIVMTNDGCRDTTTKKIKVNPRVVAKFTSDTVGCSPLKVSFNENAIGAQTFSWTFGDGGYGPAPNPSHFYINHGLNDTTYTAQLKVTSSYGCTDSVSQDIVVFAKPIADYLASPTDGCHPLPVDFVNLSSIADSCSWVFGDSHSISGCGALTLHTYKNEMSIVPVNYTSELRVYTNNGCADTLTRIIEVKPKVIADFITDTVGCSPLNATFRSQAFGAVNYYWDFGDNGQGTGMISTNRYTNTGAVDSIYTASLIAESVYQCADTVYQNILVRPTPIPNFDPTPLTQVYPNTTVSITNTTNPGNWNYRWDFDDGDTSILKDPASHTYDDWGNYWIKLNAFTDYCSDSIIKMIKIEVPAPIADFSDSAKGCEPLQVSFTNESQYGQSYKWDFGDGSTSTAENPNHLYFNEGKYDVTLIVKGYEGHKEDVITKHSYIEVYKSPKAIFFTNKDKVFIPNDPLVLVNNSRDADSYVWNFGDGNTSTVKSPVHYYQKEGEFPIYLIARSDNGCVDTFNLPTKVIAELEGRIEVPNAFTPNPNGGNGGRIDPLNKSSLNDVFYAKIAGAAKYELNIFNKWGELIYVSKDVNVGWDGYYRNELCKQDVYVWKVKVEFVDGKTLEKIGDLMLLR